MRVGDEAALRVGFFMRGLWQRPVCRAGAGFVVAATLFLLFQFAWVAPRQAWLRMQQGELAHEGMGQPVAQPAELRLAAVTDEIARLAGELGRLAPAYPSDREAPVVLRELHGIAGQSRLTLVGYTPRPPEPVALAGMDLRARRWSVQLELTGRYHDFAGFVDRVGNLPRVVRLRDVAVRAVEPETPDGTILAAVTAETFAIDHADLPAPASLRNRAATAVDEPAPPAPVASTYDPAGRRDPFSPPPAMAQPATPGERPAGLAGIAARELSLRGIVVTSGVSLAVLESPGGRSWSVRGGERLLDGAVGRIGADVVNIQAAEETSATGMPLRLRLGAPALGLVEDEGAAPDDGTAAGIAGPHAVGRDHGGEPPGGACP